MSPLAESLCQVVAEMPDLYGKPGYVRAAQIRDHLIAKPQHTRVFLGIFPLDVQMKIRVKESSLKKTAA